MPTHINNHTNLVLLKIVIKTILEQTDVLSSKFEKTWDFMDEQNQLAKSESDYLVNKLQEQTEEIKTLLEERPITLELNIEELQEKKHHRSL